MINRERPIDETPGPANNYGRDAADTSALRQIQTDIRRILHFIEGDGTEDNVGFKIKIDRLEQAQARRDKMFNLVVGAVVGLIAVEVVRLVASQMAVINSHTAAKSSAIEPLSELHTSVFTAR